MTRAPSPSRAARLQSGLTLAQVAKRLWVKPATVARWERNGFPFFHAERACKLYRARGVMVRLDDFHGGAAGTKQASKTKTTER